MPETKARISPRLLLCVLAGLLGALELGLRLADYAPPKGLLYDGTPVEGHSYENRNPHMDSPFSEATFNIAVFGGPWVFGLGCTRRETFSGRLEEALLKKNLAVRVANLSHPDFSTDDIAGIFPRSLTRCKADLAVVMTGLRDYVPEYLEEAFLARKPFSAGRRSWKDRLRVPRLLSNLRLAWTLNARPIDPADRKDYVPRRLTLADTQMRLLEIGRAAKEAGVPTIYITYPRLESPGWFSPHFPLYSGRNPLLRTTARNFGQDLLDLESLIAPDRTRDYLIPWMRWPHPNPKAHELIAGQILKILGPKLKSIPKT